MIYGSEGMLSQSMLSLGTMTLGLCQIQEFPSRSRVVNIIQKYKSTPVQMGSRKDSLARSLSSFVLCVVVFFSASVATSTNVHEQCSSNNLVYMCVKDSRISAKTNTYLGMVAFWAISENTMWAFREDLQNFPQDTRSREEVWIF